MRPHAGRVAPGGNAQIPCAAEGNPSPSLFWNREGDTNLMFPGSTHGRLSVAADGTLSIRGALREDAGYFACSAVSIAGAVTERALLEVSKTLFSFQEHFILASRLTQSKR